jgi:hypothetical protein
VQHPTVSLHTIQFCLLLEKHQDVDLFADLCGSRDVSSTASVSAAAATSSSAPCYFHRPVRDSDQLRVPTPPCEAKWTIVSSSGLAQPAFTSVADHGGQSTTASRGHSAVAVCAQSIQRPNCMSQNADGSLTSFFSISVTTPVDGNWTIPFGIKRTGESVLMSMPQCAAPLTASHAAVAATNLLELHTGCQPRAVTRT